MISIPVHCELTKEKLILAFAAYAGFTEVEPTLIRDRLYDTLLATDYTQDMKLIWGPAVHKGPVFDDAMAYIVKNKTNDEYTVVFRGTNPVSLSSWIFQDCRVDKQFLWEEAIADATVLEEDEVTEQQAKISEGVFSSLKILAGLTSIDRTNESEYTEDVEASAETEEEAEEPKELSILEYLEEVVLAENPDAKIHFSGHSLGGVMSPTFALWLLDKGLLGDPSEEETKKRIEKQIHVWAFAGPTAGNQAFVDHSDSLIGNVSTIFANNMDVVPHAWNRESLEKLPTLYKPSFGHTLFNLLVKLAINANKGDEYIQLTNTVWEEAPFKKDFGFFVLQMIYQHVVPYFTLLDFDLKEEQIRNYLNSILECLHISIDEEGHIHIEDWEIYYHELTILVMTAKRKLEGIGIPVEKIEKALIDIGIPIDKLDDIFKAPFINIGNEASKIVKRIFS